MPAHEPLSIANLALDWSPPASAVAAKTDAEGSKAARKAQLAASGARHEAHARAQDRKAGLALGARGIDDVVGLFDGVLGDSVRKAGGDPDVTEACLLAGLSGHLLGLSSESLLALAATGRKMLAKGARS